MSKKRDNVYFCHHCHQAMKNTSEVLLIEEEVNRSFCSEDCIMHFYSPRNDYFEQEDYQIRSELKVPTEEWAHEFVESSKHIKEALESPDEIWEQENELGEIYYTHLKKYSEDKGEFWFIVVCFYFQDEPSFIFFQNVTANEKLVEYYRCENTDEIEFEEEEIEQEEPIGRDEVEVSNEVLESVELKKSTFLAHLLESRSDSDIDYEKFSIYEDNTVSTLEEPDEIFRYSDEEGDTLLTYVKSYQREKQSFFYIVICMKVDLQESAKDDVLIPIVSFPSQDNDLYIKYAHGERISGNIKN